MFPIQGNQPDGTLYVDDVFSTYLYTGNGSTQTITNGIDLAGKGGMVWFKDRSTTANHNIADSVRGVDVYGYYRLFPNLTNAQAVSNQSVTAFTSNGFTVGPSPETNSTNGSNYASWTFRQAPKFFDVVTWSGDDTQRTITHNLGTAPGMIVLRRYNNTSNWIIWHRSLESSRSGGAVNLMFLNTTDAASGYTYFPSAPTSSSFEVSNSLYTNASGNSYIAYLFAHDTTTDGIIQCGSYVGTGAVNNKVTLGWEPQFLLVKQTNNDSTYGSAPVNWRIIDSMRGINTGGNVKELFPNVSDVENDASPGGTPSGYGRIELLADGFRVNDPAAGTYNRTATYIYLAIRRPNKPPTSGTQVYSAQQFETYPITLTGIGFNPDLAFNKGRTAGSWYVQDRLRGGSKNLLFPSTGAETDVAADFGVGNNSFRHGSSLSVSYTSQDLQYFFRRAPGVFDVVCYTGNSTANRQVSHNLGVAPELIIVKKRNGVDLWPVYNPATISTTNVLYLEQASGLQSNAAVLFGNGTSVVAPTATNFTLGAFTYVNDSANTYVTYLFATKPGISKVGSYTGNGSSQTINCGFTTGARFVLIKRTDSTGDWYVWDSARGIVASTDPHLSLNTTAAEVTTDDSIDPDNSGFIVNQLAATNINVNNATYIFLSFA